MKEKPMKKESGILVDEKLVSARNVHPQARELIVSWVAPRDVWPMGQVR